MKTLRLILVLLSLCIFGIQNASAQFKNGQLDVNFGLGLGAYNVTGTSNFVPINLNVQKGITDNISVGGFLAYSSSTYDYSFFYTYKLKYTDFVIGPRGEYHFNINNEKIDLYGDAILAYDIGTVKYTGPAGYDNYNHSTGSGLWFGIGAGARYHFNNNWGVYGELGYGLAVLNIGVNYRP